MHARTEFDGKDVHTQIGVTVPILTVCPCSQELVKARAQNMLRKERFSDQDIKKIFDTIPMPAHSQRARITVVMTVPPNTDIDIRDIIEIIHVKTNQVYGILKRPDELEVVFKAHQNPAFVEDLARDIAESVYLLFKGKLPSETRLLVRAMSEESIHQHDAIAQIEMTFKEIGYFVDIE
jgi:GTP cyclohydrolase-4